MDKNRSKKLNRAVSTVVESLERRRLLSGTAAFELNPLTVPGSVVDDSTGDQQQTDVDFNGGVGVTVWSDDAAGNSDDVMARIFDSAGAWTSAAFPVNTTTSGAQNQPRVAVADDGSFVVVWNDTSAAHNTITARQFAADGTPAGGEITVNTDTSNDHTNPAVGMAGDGRFVVTWDSDGQDTGGKGVYAQRFTAGGAAAGSELAVNTTTAGDQTTSSVALDDSANFIVAWTAPDASNTGIFMQRYNSTGVAQGSETGVNTTTTGQQHDASIVANGSGSYVIGWSGPDAGGEGVYFQAFDSGGLAQFAETQANTTTTADQDHPQLRLSASGSFMASFVDQSTGTPRLVGRLFGGDSTPISGEKVLNSAVVAGQRGGVATVSNSTFVVAATSNNSDYDVQTNLVSLQLHVTADSAGSDIIISENSGQIEVNLDSGITNFDALTDTLLVDGGAAADDITLNDGLALLLDNITINGGAGNDSISGSDQGELIHAGDGDDLVNGNLGDDIIYGEDGNDTLFASDGHDRVDPGLGDDTADGGTGNNVLTYQTSTVDMTIRLDGLDSGATGTSEVDIVENFIHAVGGTGNDLIVGDAQANILGGADGNDTIVTGLGNDTVFGDNGTDTVSYQDHTGAVTASLLLGTGGQAGETDNYDSTENLTGGTGNDVLTGDDNANIVDGGSGDDTLNGALGADDLRGGTGTDIVTYASRSVAVNVTLDNTANDGETGENDKLGTDVEGAIGGTANDTMTGDTQVNVFRGGAGNDTIDGAAGNDSLYGDDGRDRLLGRDGNDYAEGNNGPDLLYGFNGNDFMLGGSGSDYLAGGENNDRLKGGSHNDRLFGENGMDTLYGDNQSDSLDGGAHDDYLLGGLHNDTLLGSGGADKLFGEAGIDNLNGGAEGDRLDGGAGADTATSDVLDRIFFCETLV